MPPDKLSEFRNSRLRAFVRHTADIVSYHRRLYAGIGFNPDTVHSPEDLAPLTILMKSEAIKQGPEMYSEAFPKFDRKSRTRNTIQNLQRFHACVHQREPFKGKKAPKIDIIRI